MQKLSALDRLQISLKERLGQPYLEYIDQLVRASSKCRAEEDDANAALLAGLRTRHRQIIEAIKFLEAQNSSPVK